VIDVALTKATDVAGTPPILTVAPLRNPVPVIVIAVAPAALAVAGETPVTVGRGAVTLTLPAV